jgi:hypothetical protein
MLLYGKSEVYRDEVKWLECFLDLFYQIYVVLGSIVILGE